ncbi:ribonuclease inhibitor-like [Salvelinus sp. IW2-2015]|uniref:ribonuclease inhibitor-like n=1 Tax=Salvelinus sp. IW2-2015 TaxID=2691554 RepID=UPI0038D44C56
MRPFRSATSWSHPLPLRDMNELFRLNFPLGRPMKKRIRSEAALCWTGESHCNTGDSEAVTLSSHRGRLCFSGLSSEVKPLTPERAGLSYNHPGDSGVRLLSAGLEDPHCRLEKLKLSVCLLTEEGCDSLASALRSNPSYLRELDLSNNDLKDSGVKLLSAGLGNPHCKLETLRLSRCLVTEEGCASLVLALRSNPSHLRELDLSYNHPGVSGVRLLSARLEDPHCRLEKLKLSGCGVTEEGCASLVSALKSNPSPERAGSE